MRTKLIQTRTPTPTERKTGAEVVFIREDERGHEVKIYGARCYESWEQWGPATHEQLCDNTATIEAWRHGGTQ